MVTLRSSLASMSFYAEDEPTDSERTGGIDRLVFSKWSAWVDIKQNSEVMKGSLMGMVLFELPANHNRK